MEQLKTKMQWEWNDSKPIADNLSEQIAGVIGNENDADQYSHNFTNQDQSGTIGDVHQSQTSTNTTGQGATVEGNGNYIVEDVETDTIQSQEGLLGAYQSQESNNDTEQSGAVVGNNIEVDQIAYDGVFQDQFGADEAVQNQDSSNTTGQGAYVTGENLEAVQDSVNYAEQTQLGATDTTQDQNTETESTQLAVVIAKILS